MTTTRREKLNAMLQDDPEDQTLRYMLALECEKAGDHVQSLQHFQALMEDRVPYVPSFLMAGQQLARLGRTDEARLAYQKGIDQARLQNNDHAAGEMTQFLLELGDG